MPIQLYHGDCRDVMFDLGMARERVDLALTDPPYQIESITKRFGKADCAPAQHGRDGMFARASERFIGAEWDTDIALDVKVWSRLFRIMKPGAFLFAFANPTTGYRQAMAIERAGFKPYPFFAWTYGTGAPKPHPNGEGVFFGTAAIRPALEPIYCFQKPIAEKTFKANIQKYGVGGFDIRRARDLLDADRWPTNLVLDGSPEVNALFPLPETFSRLPYNRKAKDSDRAGIEHPTAKPIELLRLFVALACPTGGLVIDPFAGTGTTGEAARQEGSRAALIEQDAGYFEGMRRRFARRRLY